jgi:hypothetical protein
MKGNLMNDKQLELGLTTPVLRIRLRRKRAHRARWWFQQMRQAVDCAVEWRAEIPRELPPNRWASGPGSSMA